MEAKNKEVIGNIALNLDYYKGEDLYSEGAAEDVLLDLVTRYSESDYEHIIQNSKSWSVMYHLSHIRENIVTWLPIGKKSRVLEIGAGCGAVTGGLAKLAGHVDCIELSKKRSTINATRHREYSNIDIYVGNYTDVEPNLTEKYDYVTLIGVLEYAGSYIQSKEPYTDLLRSAASHLKPDGKLLVAIENKFGLKYFAGCKEDHTGEYFGGIEGYRNNTGVKTFSKGSLERMMEQLNLKGKFYYPYPDYKLAHTIYSDDMLPNEGELNTNLRNFDNDRVVLFDETKAFDSIIEEGKFDYFSNSFLVVMTKEDIYDCLKVVPIFAKYANERRNDLRVATILYKNKGDKPLVYKCAGNNTSNTHIRNISKNYNILCERCQDTKFEPNKCQYIQGEEPVPLVAGATSKAIDVINFEYISGMSMDSYIFDLADAKKYDEIEKIIRKYISEVALLNGNKPFKQTQRFEEVFGKYKFDSSYTGAEESDFDIIFSNIIFDKEKGADGPWNLIDYEWCFDFPIPDRFMAFRGLYYYFEFSNPTLKVHFESENENVYQRFGFTEDEIKMFIEMEHNFQVFTIGGVASLEVLHAIMPTNTVFLDNILRESNALKNLNNPKIYYSYGEGYSDDRRIYIIPKVDGAKVEMDIPLASNMRGVRIDPTEYDSIVSIKEIYLVSKSGEVKWVDEFLMNGYMVSDKTILYNTNDAQIIVDNISPNMDKLHISYDVSMFLPNIYEDFMKLCKQKQKEEYKEPGFKDKLLMKLHLKRRPAPLPEGYHYNVVK
ncbi:MAG: class I SAM-dependent methyltransferase [Lachnospiraceae bacterium]|nr:class I SAM-dependent methyltransferase [Lachnospiraceae bacterium]